VTKWQLKGALAGVKRKRVGVGTRERVGKEGLERNLLPQKPGHLRRVEGGRGNDYSGLRDDVERGVVREKKSTGRREEGRGDGWGGVEGRRVDVHEGVKEGQVGNQGDGVDMEGRLSR